MKRPITRLEFLAHEDPPLSPAVRALLVSLWVGAGIVLFCLLVSLAGCS